jgi:hypothetical protein
VLPNDGENGAANTLQSLWSVWAAAQAVLLLGCPGSYPGFPVAALSSSPDRRTPVTDPGRLARCHSDHIDGARLRRCAARCSDQAVIRLGGVYALARLDDHWRSQRQTCVHVLCAYSRIPPYAHPDTSEHHPREGPDPSFASSQPAADPPIVPTGPPPTSTSPAPTWRTPPSRTRGSLATPGSGRDVFRFQNVVQRSRPERAIPLSRC